MRQIILVPMLFFWLAIGTRAGTIAVAAEASDAASAWSASYAEARAAMLAGQFGPAADKFAALAERAPDAPSRFLATEMMSACRTWAAGGLVLAQPHDLSLTRPALLEDRRTTDEIATLYTTAVLYGLYAGLVVDAWSKPSSVSGAIPPPLLLAGASAGVVALIDHNHRLGYGVAQSIESGLYIGIEEGVAWALWHEARSPHSSEWGARAVMTLILGTGLAGAAAGGVVGTVHGTTPGRAALMGSGAMWGSLVAGTLVGGLTGVDDHAMLAAALMLNAGAVGAVLAGTEVSPSIARVRFIDLGGLSGGLLVGGVFWALGGDHTSGRKLLAAASIGMAAGLVTAWIFTRDMETDEPRKKREPGLAERLLPTVAPATSGTGLIVGVGAPI